MRKILVVGIGSLIMTDDGIGTRVAGAIQAKLQENNIDVLCGETDVQYCLRKIKPDDLLVIIDAVMLEKEPGSIEIFPLQDAAKSRCKLQSQHDFSLLDAIILHYPDMQGYVIGIEAAKICLGFDLSGDLEKSFNLICNNVLNAIFEIREAVSRA